MDVEIVISENSEGCTSTKTQILQNGRQPETK